MCSNIHACRHAKLNWITINMQGDVHLYVSEKSMHVFAKFAHKIVYVFTIWIHEQ